MKYIDVLWNNFGKSVLRIGCQGENKATCVLIDVSQQLKNNPDATFSLNVCTPDGSIFPAEDVKLVGNSLLWTVLSRETSIWGDGWVQIMMHLDNDSIIKSHRSKTYDAPGVTGKTQDPIQDWLEEAHKLLDELKDHHDCIDEPDHHCGCHDHDHHHHHHPHHADHHHNHHHCDCDCDDSGNPDDSDYDIIDGGTAVTKDEEYVEINMTFYGGDASGAN